MNTRLGEFIDSADPIYGTGADGDIVLDGVSSLVSMVPSSNVYTMWRDMYFNDLTIEAGVRLQPHGYRIFVKNQLIMKNGSSIGFTSGWSAPGSIAQGGGLNIAVANSLGGSSVTQLAVEPIAALGGREYYYVPHQAIRGWAVSASSPTPEFLRGGAGGVGQYGGGVVITAARYMSIEGSAQMSAPGIPPAGGGVVILISSSANIPSGLTFDVSGASFGTEIYMQLV